MDVISTVVPKMEQLKYGIYAIPITRAALTVDQVWIPWRFARIGTSLFPATRMAMSKYGIWEDAGASIVSDPQREMSFSTIPPSRLRHRVIRVVVAEGTIAAVLPFTIPKEWHPSKPWISVTIQERLWLYLITGQSLCGIRVCAEQQGPFYNKTMTMVVMEWTVWRSNHCCAPSPNFVLMHREPIACTPRLLPIVVTWWLRVVTGRPNYGIQRHGSCRVRYRIKNGCGMQPFVPTLRISWQLRVITLQDYGIYERQMLSSNTMDISRPWLVWPSMIAMSCEARVSFSLSWPSCTPFFEPEQCSIPRSSTALTIWLSPWCSMVWEHSRFSSLWQWTCGWNSPFGYICYPLLILNWVVLVNM